MDIGVDLVVLASFAVALVRAAAFVALAPPFAGGLFSVQVRSFVAIALALASFKAVPVEVGSYSTAEFAFCLVSQAAIGVALGYGVLGVLSAARAAGELIDNMTGSTLSSIFDPISGNSSPVFGRFFQLAFTAFLFVMNGQLLLARGFVRTFEAVPLVQGIDIAKLSEQGVAIVSQLVVAALEISAPIVLALFITEMVLALLARAAPTLNVLVLGLGVKALLAVILVGMFVPAMPELTRTLMDHVATVMGGIVGAFS